MKKIETIWHFLLFQALNKGIFRHTQQDMARRFRMSLSTVHHALRYPVAIGAIRKETKFFVLEDAIKLLYYWASVRNLHRRIFYTTHSDAPIAQIEGLAPPTGIFAGFSAGRIILGEAPADYGIVYLYDDPTHIKDIQTRFPPFPNKRANVFFLIKTPDMDAYGQHTTLPLTFVDIWNLPDWYSKNFTEALEEKIHGLLSRSSH